MAEAGLEHEIMGPPWERGVVRRREDRVRLARVWRGGWGASNWRQGDGTRDLRTANDDKAERRPQPASARESERSLQPGPGAQGSERQWPHSCTRLSTGERCGEGVGVPIHSKLQSEGLPVSTPAPRPNTHTRAPAAAGNTSALFARNIRRWAPCLGSSMKKRVGRVEKDAHQYTFNLQRGVVLTLVLHSARTAQGPGGRTRTVHDARGYKRAQIARQAVYSRAELGADS